jgi:hypothetical protein
MEKDIDRIPKNQDTDIVIRIDDFGGKVGVTIREFVRGERYSGFTKSGTRIPAEHFSKFKEAINSIDEKDLVQSVASSGESKYKEKKHSVESEESMNGEKEESSEEVDEIPEEEF